MDTQLKVAVNQRYITTRDIRFCVAGSGWITIPSEIVLTVASDKTTRIGDSSYYLVETSHEKRGFVSVLAFSDGRLKNLDQ